MNVQGQYRIATDVGGTFTDLVIESARLGRRFYKRPTTPDDPVIGLLNVVAAAADDLGMTSEQLLADVGLFVHGTTRATNAIVTKQTARTAFLCTEGHPDTLLWREGGGRRAPLDYTQEFPDPYVPRALTFEISERITASGDVMTPLDEEQARAVIKKLATLSVEAVAVCLLWSIVNPAHENALREILLEELPGIPFTLSHELNPTIREYRRASSTAIDASLKPLMSSYLSDLSGRLASAGFAGRLLILTSGGGALGLEEVAAAPIHSIGSGPAAAPVAGRHYAAIDADAKTAIVTDAGGTTFDVGLLLRGEIPWTRETLVGEFPGFITGFPSVDVRSVGAGGGSIAEVDSGGLLRVGPESAGAVPGPAAYGLGGERATVTDACVVLGYVDPDYFLGGTIQLRSDLAAAAIDVIASELGITRDAAAGAIFDLAIERMVLGIEDVTLTQGLDPSEATVVAGGGGGGLYGVAIAQRLGATSVVVPEQAPALSATGALISDLRRDWARIEVMTTADFDTSLANNILADLRAKAEQFVAFHRSDDATISFSVEARYENQHWELEVPLRSDHLGGTPDVDAIVEDFHLRHEQSFAHVEIGSAVEIVTWRAEARCRVGTSGTDVATIAQDPPRRASRDAYFTSTGWCNVPVLAWYGIAVGSKVDGPVLIEAPTTTVVVPHGCTVSRTSSGSLVVSL